MSLRKMSLGPIPELTARAARGSFRKGHVYLAFADAFGDTFDWDDFEDVYPAKGQWGVHPVQLALATVLQFAEGFSDRQAAAAVRSRIDWKYVLRLEIDHPGFDHSVLSEFRDRLGTKISELLDKILHFAEEGGLLDSRKQRTDSTHILAAVRKLCRLELVHEAMSVALDDLLVLAPGWVRDTAPGTWYERYGRPFNHKLKKAESARDKLAAEIGRDGFRLLSAIDRSEFREKFRELPSVIALERIWEEQFTDDGNGPRFRAQGEYISSSSEMIASPHDLDARLSRKRSEQWVGYKVHFTETHSAGSPHLITNVVTTHGCVDDSEMLPQIHRSLRQRGLAPEEHLVDYGYTDTNEMLSASELGIRVIGPAKLGPTWQSANAEGFDQSHFHIEWEDRQAICPNGVKSNKWRSLKESNSIAISFPADECLKCPVREQCTKSKNGGRKLEVKERHLFEFLLELRNYQTSDEFKDKYRSRSGVEGTISQAVRRSNLRRSRYLGQSKTHVQHLLTAAALNVVRIGSWILGRPLAQTRIRRLAILAA